MMTRPAGLLILVLAVIASSLSVVYAKHQSRKLFVELQSLGIPAEVVSVPPNKILRPDLQIDNVDATTRWRTFWYLAEDEDL